MDGSLQKKSLVEELDIRQNDVLQQIDALNALIESAIQDLTTETVPVESV